jgi:hypothetical protein
MCRLFNLLAFNLTMPEWYEYQMVLYQRISFIGWYLVDWFCTITFIIFPIIFSKEPENNIFKGLKET